jgi:RNA-binding protein
MTLTSKQRQYLRGLAHSFEPVVRVGRAGVSDAVIAETVKSLAAHELIKVRIDAEGDERRKLAESLATATGSEIAGLVGKTAMLFRQRDEKPSIKLP